MLQPSVRGASARLLNSIPIIRPSSLECSFAALRISPSRFALTPQTTRHASHKSESRANGAKNGAGKRLGAKKTGDQYVVPGNILYRQRGTLWFPGENVSMGRDHTLHAAQAGYVRFYKDPRRHPRRKYIGVVFEKHMALPVPPGVARRRRLGFVARRMPAHVWEAETGRRVLGVVDGEVEETAAEEEERVEEIVPEVPEVPESGLAKLIRVSDALAGSALNRARARKGRDPNRKTNWEVGKVMDEAQKMVKPYHPDDRRRVKKVEMRRAEQARLLKRSAKAGKKGKK